MGDPDNRALHVIGVEDPGLLLEFHHPAPERGPSAAFWRRFPGAAQGRNRGQTEARLAIGRTGWSAAVPTTFWTSRDPFKGVGRLASGVGDCQP